MPGDWLGGVRCRGGVTLFLAAIGNVETGRADAKREIRVVGATRMSVPMQRTGADPLVVAMKSGNADGAKGRGHSVLAVGQPARGGAHG